MKSKVHNVSSVRKKQWPTLETLSLGHTAHDNDTITIPKKSFAY